MRTHDIHVATGRMIKMLQDVGNCSAHELAEESELQYMTVLKILSTWRRSKVIHVSGWEPDAKGRFKTRLWSLGSKRDTPKPAPVGPTTSERYAIWKKRDDMARLLGVKR